MNTTIQSPFRRIVAYVSVVALIFGALTLSAVDRAQHSPAGASTSNPIMSPGTVLGEGQALSNGPFLAILQADGNFVLYDNSKPLWASNTSQPNDPHNFLVMQADGNLVIYNASNHPVWASGSSGVNAYLVLQGDGNLVLYSNPSGTPRPVWATGTSISADPPPAPTPTTAPAPSPSRCSPSNSAGGAVMGTWQTLTEGHALSDGQFFGLLQTDGNFVIYNGTTPIWATNTSQSSDPHNFLIMQGDGNLVMYNASCVPVWATNTSGANGFAVLQQDANFVVYSNPSGSPIAKWASGVTGSGVPSSVGVYAYPSPPASNAFADGWNSIGDTAAMGTASSPYTGLVGGGIDYGAGVAAAQAGKPWLSFWTVSGPLNGSCAGSSTGSTGSNGSILGTSGIFGEGSSITSPNHVYTALLQTDGNFVVYKYINTPQQVPIWSTGTNNNGGTNTLIMQVDGNLVLYKNVNTPRQSVAWASGSCVSNTSTPGPFLLMQDDGNLVVYYNTNTPIWSSFSGLPPTIGTPAQYYSIGYAAGVYAANTINSYGGIRPTYEILDPEGYPDNHSGLDQSGIGSAQWQQMMAGWANGLNTVGGMHPAFYATQYEYLHFSLASINLPFFVAVAFGSDGGSGIVPPQRLNGVNGSNIVGVTAFYSGVTGSVQCATVVQAANAIANWGYRYNTLQFDGGLRCRA